MSNTRSFNNADDDDEYESDDYEVDEYDEPDDGHEDDDADEPTLPCPYCRRPIHEDAQRCPYCERYISAEDSPGSAKPWWLLVGVAICLAIVVSWFL